MRETLTHGERLRRTLRRQPVDRLPDYEFGCWPQTIFRWRQEGLEIDPPPWETDPNGPWWGASDGYHGRYDMDVIDQTFGTDRAEFDLRVGMGVSTGLYPGFDTEVLEEHGDYQIFRGRMGRARREDATGTWHGHSSHTAARHRNSRRLGAAAR